MANSQAPKFSQMQGLKRVAKAFGNIAKPSVRVKSRMTVYKELKEDLSKTMSKTKAAGMALDAVTGSHLRGSTKNKVEVMKALGREDKLNSKFKDGSTYQFHKAVHAYEAAVEANSPKGVLEVEQRNVTIAQDEPKIARAKAYEAEREARLYDKRVAHLEEKNKDVTTSISHVGKTETKAVSSVAHVGEIKTEAVTSVIHLNSVHNPAVTSIAHIEKKSEPDAVVPTGHRLPTTHASVLDLPADEQRYPAPVQFGDEIKKEAEREAPLMQLD